MREIKFRFYAHYRHQMYDSLSIGCGLGNADLASLNEAIQDIVLNGRGVNHESHVKYTIMQYTGLKDRKRTKEYPEGQEIYEGDIITTHYSETELWGFKRNRIVEIQSPFIHPFPLTLTCDGVEHNPFYKMRDIEIIGNIYEQPELIK